MPIFTSNGWTITKQTLLLLSLSVLANSAFANVCKDDINALCEAEKGDRKAVMECLESNKSDLSSECSEQVDKMMAQGGKSGGKGSACKDDINSLCEAEKGDQKAVMECLESNKSDLSSECSEQVDKMMAQGGKSGGKGSACKDDINSLCEAEKGDQKAVMECLESNKSDLSSECSERLDKMMAQGGKSGGKRGVCQDAIEEYCLDARPQGREAVEACLVSHKDDLSSECAARVDKMMTQGGKSGGKRGVCQDAIEEYCLDARPQGREAVDACLVSHKDDLSSECAARVDKMLAQ